jgi:hypothetical protein
VHALARSFYLFKFCLLNLPSLLLRSCELLCCILCSPSFCFSRVGAIRFTIFSLRHHLRSRAPCEHMLLRIQSMSVLLFARLHRARNTCCMLSLGRMTWLHVSLTACCQFFFFHASIARVHLSQPPVTIAPPREFEAHLILHGAIRNAFIHPLVFFHSLHMQYTVFFIRVLIRFVGL